MVGSRGSFCLVCDSETKGKTLEDMDAVFGSFTAQTNKEILAAIRSEVGLTQLLGGGSSGIVSNYKLAGEGEKGDSTDFVETV